MFQNVSYKAYIKGFQDIRTLSLVRVPKMRIFTKPVSESDPMWSNKMVDCERIVSDRGHLRFLIHRGCMKIHFYSE